jgi:signal transduction histidine kinase
VRKIRRLRFSLKDVDLGPVAALAPSGGPAVAPNRGPAVASNRGTSQRADRQAGEPASEPAVAEDPPELLRVIGEGSWSYWPLRGGDRHVGVLAALRGSPGNAASSSGADPEEWIRGFCQHAGLALEQAGIRRAHRVLEENRRTLEQVTQEVLAATSLVDLLRIVTETAVQALDCGWATVWLVRHAADTLEAAAEAGSSLPSDEELPAIAERAEAIRGSRRTIRVPTAAQEGNGEGSLLLIPLLAFDRDLGVLGAGGRRPRDARDPGGFDEEDERLALDLAARVAVSIRNAQLFEELRAAEAQLREIRALLTQTEKLAALGEMTAKLVHEIRNPLAAIGGFARRIESSLPRSDSNGKHAGLIHREVRRLEALLTERLEIARIRGPRLVNLDLGELVRESVRLLRAEAGPAGVEVVEEIQVGLPEVLLDRDQIKQVLLNIFKNALQATSQGKTIRVRTLRSGDSLQVEIANNGRPIEGRALEQLFVPFASDRPGGSGLGLAVARQIVQDHGGEIQVRTEEPWSAVFVLRFPVRENQDRRKTRGDRRSRRDRRHAA